MRRGGVGKAREVNIAPTMQGLGCLMNDVVLNHENSVAPSAGLENYSWLNVKNALWLEMPA